MVLPHKLRSSEDLTLTKDYKSWPTVDAGKAGAGREAASSSRMSLDEAYRILGIERQSPLEEVLKVTSQVAL